MTGPASQDPRGWPTWTSTRSRKLRRSGAAALVLAVAGGGLILTAPTAVAAVDKIELEVGSDGTGPWDALDDGATNGIVRTNDVVSYNWAYTTDSGAASDVTFVQTLTAPTPAAVRFQEANLTQCTGPAGGSISADGHTFTCQVTLPANASGSVPITVRVGGTAENGEKIVTTLTADTKNSGSQETLIAALPQLNLVKNTFSYFDPTTVDGVPGMMVKYVAAITAQNSAKGLELVTEDLHWTDDLSQVSPHATLATCHVYGYADSSYRLPYGKIGSPGNANNSVTDSGSISCEQPGGPGTNINLSVTGADLSGDSLPAMTSNGSALPVNIAYLATYRIDVFIPREDFEAAGGRINTVNQYRGFDPNSVSGLSNFGDGYEPGGAPDAPACVFTGETNDNCRAMSVNSGDGDLVKYLSATDDSYPTTPGGASGLLAGNGTVGPGAHYFANIYVGNRGINTFSGAAACDRWDPNTQKIVKSGRVYGQGRVLTEGVDYTVEYATLPGSSDNDYRATACTDEAGTWYPTIDEAGGPTRSTPLDLSLNTIWKQTAIFVPTLNSYRRNCRTELLSATGWAAVSKQMVTGLPPAIIKKIIAEP